MKKRILSVALAVVMVVCLCGCSDVETESENSDSTTFTTVETGREWKIVYHNETKVMYVVSDFPYNKGSFCLLVNADGTPILYETDN